MPESDSTQLQKNMALLKQYHPELFDFVSSHEEANPRCELVFAQNQKANIRVNMSGGGRVLIHDAADPGRESGTFLSMVSEQSSGVILIFGMGLGYGVLELLRKRKNIQAVAIFELNPEFFIYGLEQMDFTDLLCDKRVILSVGDLRQIAPALSPINTTLMLEDIHTLNLTTCFKVNPGYKELSSVVFDYVNAMNAEGNTKRLYGKEFIKNRLRHLTSIHHDQKLEDLTGKFKQIPALIVAAGPSLDKNIDQLARAVGKAVIIAADTALPTLLNRGIIPDFVTAIDYKELTYEKIANVASDDRCRQTNLICTSWVTHKVTKIFPANHIFWAFSINALEQWINNLLGGSRLIAGAGTVAHLNFISANMMGCDPIIFVGQDLAFSENKGHASNVALSSEKRTTELLNDPQGIRVPGVIEPEVVTNRQMHSYLRGFEDMIRKTKEQVINATEGGAFIEGTKVMSLSDAIDQFCTRKVDLEIPSSSHDSRIGEAMAKTQKEIIKINRALQKADKLADSVTGKLAKLNRKSKMPRAYSDLPGSIQKKISDLDACHKAADENPLWSIFDEITMDGLRHNEREKYEIQKLEGIPEKYLDWLLKSIVRVNKVNQIRIENLDWFKKEINGLLEYLEKESACFDATGQNRIDKKAVMRLAELYVQSENYVLLDKLLEIHGEVLDEHIVQFYKGLISLCHGEYDRAENLFESAISSDNSLAEKISGQRRKFAEDYLSIALAESTAVFRSHSIVMMLLEKGLKCYPDHGDIRAQIKKRFEKDLEEIQKAFKGNPEQMDPGSLALMKDWLDTIDHKLCIVECLEQNSLSRLFDFAGSWNVQEKRYQDALGYYQKGLAIGPENPEILISMADICFTQENFESGIQYLKAAVALNKQYGVYWYNMGKNLQVQKDFEGAILAFEQYFIALPENIIALKEIGDCHKKLGSMAAAQEAYRQFERFSDKTKDQ